MRVRSVGERVSFAASPTIVCRTVYTGRIERVVGTACYVREENWNALLGIQMNVLHDAGAYVITDEGQPGIRWTDTKSLELATRGDAERLEKTTQRRKILRSTILSELDDDKRRR